MHMEYMGEAQKNLYNRGLTDSLFPYRIEVPSINQFGTTIRRTFV